MLPRSLVWALLAWAGMLPALAHAGNTDGEVDLDFLAALDRDASGKPVSAGELGMRLRGAVEPGKGWAFRWDYRGREPVLGNSQNSHLRLLYVADVAKTFGPVSLALGRFPAPSMVLLPVDGLRVDLATKRVGATFFAGRRAISTSRRNVAWSRFLPAGGVVGQLRFDRLRIDAGGAVYQDDLVLGTKSAGYQEPYTTWNAKASLVAWPSKTVSFGLRGVVAPWVSYTFASSTELDSTLRAADLYNGTGWVRWRPQERVRLGADAIYQQALVQSTDVPILDPTFADLRLHAAWHAPHLGWLRARWVGRIRRARLENRLRLEGRITDLFPPYLAGAIELVSITGKDQPDDVGLIDRLQWRVGVGYRSQRFDIEGGIAYDERAAVPVSGLDGDLASLEPTRPVDFSLFELEAQDFAYLRSFYAGRAWFAGADLETNVLDREIRGMVQVGALWDAKW